MNPINMTYVPETNEIVKKKISNINFSSSATNSLEKQPNEDSFEKKGMSTTGKVALGTVGLLGGLAALDAVFCKSKNLKKIFGIAQKEGGKVAEDTAVDTTTKEIKKTFKELYNDAIKNQEKSIKNEITGRTHNFEYDENGRLIKEIVTKGNERAEILHNLPNKRKSELVSLTKDGKYYTKERARLIKQARNDFEFNDKYGNIYKVKNGEILDDVFNAEGKTFRLSEQAEEFQEFVQKEF